MLTWGRWRRDTLVWGGDGRGGRWAAPWLVLLPLASRAAITGRFLWNKALVLQGWVLGERLNATADRLSSCCAWPCPSATAFIHFSSVAYVDHSVRVDAELVLHEQVLGRPGWRPLLWWQRGD